MAPARESAATHNPSEKVLERTYDYWYRASSTYQNPAGHGVVDDYARRFMYHFWPWHQIVWLSAKREHIIAKLFPFSVSLTRVERWTVLVSALQACMFLQTFFWRADCLMVP